VLSEGTQVSLWFERSLTPAWGLFGGETGDQPDVEIVSAVENEHLLKVNGRKVLKGDRVIVRTGGGGGFGSPVDRKEADKERDIRNGYLNG
jgi:N-methylhydantoinase B